MGGDRQCTAKVGGVGAKCVLSVLKLTRPLPTFFFLVSYGECGWKAITRKFQLSLPKHCSLLSIQVLNFQDNVHIVNLWIMLTCECHCELMYIFNMGGNSCSLARNSESRTQRSGLMTFCFVVYS